MRALRTSLADDRGFSLMDMIASVAIIATISAMAAPPMANMVDQYRLGMSTRTVERELQFAKLKAVSSQSPMRVRFNCPAAGQLRVVELIGTTKNPDANDADSFLTRCNEAAYPYKPTGSDSSRLTKPNNDGAVRLLDKNVTFSGVAQTLEFWPDGTVHYPGVAGTAGANIGTAGVAITLTKGGKTKNIVVNGLGKIQMDR
jgi:type II secretory pathway pseudopilin PulG